MDNLSGLFSFWSAGWLAEQLVVWLFLTVAVSFGVNWWRNFQERRKTEQFTGWTLILLGDDDPGKPGDHQSLHWEEVRRVISSDFEMWKLVKSTVSGYGHLTVSKLKPAKDEGWTYLDYNERKLVVDFNKIPCDHLIDGQWGKSPKYLADTAKCPALNDSPSESE